jgi:hypothetical protein
MGSRLRQSGLVFDNALDHDDIGLFQSKIMNVIDSKHLERENRFTLFLIPLWRSRTKTAKLATLSSGRVAVNRPAVDADSACRPPVAKLNPDAAEWPFRPARSNLDVPP